MHIPRAVSLLFLFLNFKVACAAEVQDDQSAVFNETVNRLKIFYDAKLDEMNKKLALQEQSYNELRRQYFQMDEALRTITRDRRLLDDRLLQTTTPTPAIPKVAFFAQLSHDKTSLGDYQVIEYDLVTTNIGNAYNRADGLFTTPVSGTYVFSWTAANHDRTHMWSQIVVNGQMIGKTLSDSADHNDISVASNMVVIALKAGDVVCIRSMTAHTHTLMGGQMSTFSGFLLYSD